MIEYLLEENRTFKQPMRGRRLRLTDAQRARLAVKGKALGRKVLNAYHRERNHQGLGNELIRPDGTPHSTTGAAHCRERLGGLLRFYHRDAG